MRRTMGIIMMARAKTPAHPVGCGARNEPSNWIRNAWATRPTSTLGTPVRISAQKRVALARRVLRYSTQKTAARMPSGAAMAVAQPTSIMVPTTACPRPGEG